MTRDALPIDLREICKSGIAEGLQRHFGQLAMQCNAMRWCWYSHILRSLRFTNEAVHFDDSYFLLRTVEAPICYHPSQCCASATATATSTSTVVATMRNNEAPVDKDDDDEKKIECPEGKKRWCVYRMPPLSNWDRCNIEFLKYRSPAVRWGPQSFCSSCAVEKRASNEVN